MGSLIDTIMWFATIMFIVFAIAFIAIGIIVIITGAANGDHQKDDDEEQLEYMRQYTLRKEEKKRARAVSRELRRERLYKNHHGKGASAKDKGDCVLPEENPEGVILPGQNQEGD